MRSVLLTLTWRVAAAGLLLAASGCGGGHDGTGVGDEAADRLGVFVRAESGEMTLWLDLGDNVWLRSTRCSDADLVGVERDGVYYPVSIHGPGLCGAAGDVHPITGPFPIDRSDGVTVTLGDDQLAFGRPSDLPLDPAFTAGPLAVTDSAAVGLQDGAVRLQIDDDRLRGVTPCQQFEAPLERRGSLLATGDLRHSGDCPDDQPLLDALANRTMAALAMGEELALLAGPGLFVQLQPGDGAPLTTSDGLDRTAHRDPAPVTGELHAFTYEVDGETREMGEAGPFRIVLSDDAAVWYRDCNEVSAGGHWEGTRLVATSGSSTAVGCPDLAATADIALEHGFGLEQANGRWTLTEGALTIALTPGPPVDPEAPIPAGTQWAGAGIGWSPFSFSGSGGSTVRLTVDDAGQGTLETGCRQIPLDLAPGAERLVVGGDLPPSTCGHDDAAAPIDAWAESIVTAEYAGAYMRSEQMVLSGAGARSNSPPPVLRSLSRTQHRRLRTSGSHFRLVEPQPRPWRSSLPGVSPVQVPSSNVTCPLTMMSL